MKMGAKQTRTTGRRRSLIAKGSAPAHRHPRGNTAAPRTTVRRGANEEVTMNSPEEYVRVRAYFLSLNRDQGPSDPVADWLRAEQELSVEEAAE